ncbi:MAG: hypothetical protein LQ340_001859, partial [Diploschistes diacapsis]
PRIQTLRLLDLEILVEQRHVQRPVLPVRVVHVRDQRLAVRQHAVQHVQRVRHVVRGRLWVRELHEAQHRVVGLRAERLHVEVGRQGAEFFPGHFFLVAVVEVDDFGGLAVLVVAPHARAVPGLVGGELGADEIADFGRRGEGWGWGGDVEGAEAGHEVFEGAGARAHELKLEVESCRVDVGDGDFFVVERPGRHRGAGRGVAVCAGR